MQNLCRGEGPNVGHIVISTNTERSLHLNISLIIVKSVLKTPKSLLGQKHVDLVGYAWICE